MFDHLPYRPCVGLALFNNEGKVFVGERLDNPGAWQMPQGGIDPGETVEKAAFRELLEEVGTDKAEIIRVADQTICYDLPPERVPQFWGGRYRGQEQSWVAMRFAGQDSDVILDGHSEPEFLRWQWVRLEETVGLIVPFKRETYRKVISLFADLV
jgi:putative (di)nucleoside polyphosphate hydrolase